MVASLNRPSGNLTGVATVGDEIAGKRFELLHKLVPAADTIAMLARSTGSAISPGRDESYAVRGRCSRGAPAGPLCRDRKRGCRGFCDPRRAACRCTGDRLQPLLPCGISIKSYRSRVAMLFQPCFLTAIKLRAEGSRATELSWTKHFANRVSIPAVSSRARNPPNCRSCGRPSLSSSSTSKLPRRSALPSRKLCWPPPTR